MSNKENVYHTRVLKIGNSEGVTIPSDIRNQLQIGEGDYVRITVTKMRLEEAA